jgi:hypothetical protein
VSVEKLKLIEALAAAKAPSRALDHAIAQMTRFQKGVPYTPEDDDGVPRFTASFDAAQQLASEAVPNHVAACTWEPGLASAQIEGHDAVAASSPALALCLAAVKAIHQG